jgi:hypothetical protein
VFADRRDGARVAALRSARDGRSRNERGPKARCDEWPQSRVPRPIATASKSFRMTGPIMWATQERHSITVSADAGNL